MKKSPAKTYEDIPKDFEYLRNKLKLRSLEAKDSFNKKYPHVNKFLKQKGVEVSNLRQHSAKVIGLGALTGTLLFAPPAGISSLPAPQEIIDSVRNLADNTNSPDLPQKILVETLNDRLPERTRPLERDEEKFLEQIFENVVGIRAKATLEGEHLNTTYGLIGAEQHLQRFPGDTIAGHAPFLKEGIAPGRGAWGYFAPTRSALTPALEETERWYAVVQTLYLPDWNTRQPYLRDWYKYRKVLMVNTKNGNAVVAAIADSGPAAWTGKHFGGSPEVMEYLGGPRYKKGPVITFFVDDPENKVPLGPVEYNKMNLPEVAMTNI